METVSASVASAVGTALLDPYVLAAIVTGVLTLLGLIFEKQRRAHAELAKGVEATRYQVQNDHDTNLREDLDRVIEGLDDIKTILHEHGRAIGGIRDDIRLEREQRMGDIQGIREDNRNLVKRFDNHLESNNP